MIDADGGAADSMSVQPPDPACDGTRGQEVWTDCGDGLGVGAST